MMILTPSRPSSASEQLGVSRNATVEDAGPSGCREHRDRGQERVACSRSFSHFLKHWRFVNRETGQVQTFATLWPGQQDAVAEMETHDWLFLLKAGKLGFTELECAFDGWVALYRHSNAHVNLFSLDAKEAKVLLQIVRFGLTHLPDWLGLSLMADRPGGDTTNQIKLYGGVDDERVVTSYATTKTAAIAVTAAHSHVDELARMAWPKDTWASVQSTVAPGGSVHIVSRGAGEDNYAAELFQEAKEGVSPLKAFFANWRRRPRAPKRDIHEGEDAERAWYEEQGASMDSQHLSFFAPETEEEALAGSAEDAFVAVELWDACFDPELPSLVGPDGTIDQTPIVLALDAGVTGDLFAAVAISRHPKRRDEPAVRAVRVWRPPEKGEIKFGPIENWIKMVCLGGCVNGHPNKRGKLSQPPDGEECEACTAGNRVQAHKVIQLTYDPYQLVDMTQRFRREEVAWCSSFDQGTERLAADGNLRQLITQRKIAHAGDGDLRDHVKNAKAKIDPKEDTKLRIVKRYPGSKIDLLVAVSMGVARAMHLRL